MLNGLRVSEACAADVADLEIERAHRVLAVVGKGGARVIVPWLLEPSARSMRRWAGASTGRSCCPWPVAGWIAMTRPGSCAGSPAGPAW